MRDRTIAQVIAGLERRGVGDGRHSAAYRLLRGKHDVLSPRLGGAHPGWQDVVSELTAAGVVAKGEKPLTANSLRQIWKRVCRDVEAEAKAKAAAAAKSGGMPSRMSASWRPTEAAPTGARAVAVVAPRYGAAPSTALTPTQPVSGSQNSTPKSPPAFPTVDPAGNKLEEGMVWFDGEPTLLRVAQEMWRVSESGKAMDRRWQGLA